MTHRRGSSLSSRGRRPAEGAAPPFRQPSRSAHRRAPRSGRPGSRRRSGRFCARPSPSGESDHGSFAAVPLRAALPVPSADAAVSVPVIVHPVPCPLGSPPRLGGSGFVGDDTDPRCRRARSLVSWPAATILLWGAVVAVQQTSRDAVAYFSDNALQFDALYQSSPDFVYRLALWGALIDRYSAPANLTLDVGCGSGLMTFIAARGGGRVIGIDGAPDMIRLCEERRRRETARQRPLRARASLRARRARSGRRRPDHLLERARVCR